MRTGVAVAVGLTVGMVGLRCASASDTAPATTATAPERPAAQPSGSAKNDAELETIIVRAIPLEKDVLPTRRSFNSVYGLDLGVLDTPRNITAVSTNQLETIDVRDPRDFSKLTSSSYTDSAFGAPVVPRIRGQYADLFFNGMRDSFVVDGNGAPFSFNSVESVNIIKGPPSVALGAGPGVGGAIDLIAKYPRFKDFGGFASVDFESYDQRRWVLDLGGPFTDKLAFRLSYTGEESDSYYKNLYHDQHSVYGALAFKVTDNYTIDVQAEGSTAHYTENVGINRVNQGLIDHGTYLTGVPVGTALFSFDPTNLTPVGSPGNPFSPATGILTVVNLTNPVTIDRSLNLDATPGTGGDSVSFHANVIQTAQLADSLQFVNNTFYNYDKRDKIGYYYYANSYPDNWSIENRSEFKGDFSLPLGSNWAIKNSFDTGFTFRFAHVLAITNFNSEPASIYDLTTDPNLWRFSDFAQFDTNGSPLPQYKSAFGHILFGVPGRDGTNGGDTNESDTYDVGVFFQDRVEFDPQFSFLFGGRVDFIRADIRDPLGGPIYNGLPETTSTSWHPLPNFNLSPVWKITPTLSAYFTYNYAETLNGGGANGGVWTYGKTIDYVFHQPSELFEGGLKASLVDNAVFADVSLFRQTKPLEIGAANTKATQATIKGVEAEIYYQPDDHLYVTASYSYVQTALTDPAGFYNYPATSGLNIDGAALFAVFKPGQEFKDPGVPEHLFNFLVNYKFDSGFGFNLGLVLTGPIDTTTSGQLDLTQSLFVPASIVANGGYYKSPQIPWQYTIDLGFSYTIGPVEARLSFYNITDEKNWQAANPFYGNDFLIAEQPFRVGGSIKYRF